MITTEGFIAVISLVLTAFGLGYAIGSNNSQKYPITCQSKDQSPVTIINKAGIYCRADPLSPNF